MSTKSPARLWATMRMVSAHRCARDAQRKEAASSLAGLLGIASAR
jgi:hypothetical protein